MKVQLDIDFLAGKVGMSLLLVSPDELQLYKRVCHTLKKPTGLPSFHINDNYMMAIAKRVRIAKEIDQFAHKRKKVKTNWYFFFCYLPKFRITLCRNIISKIVKLSRKLLGVSFVRWSVLFELLRSFFDRFSYSISSEDNAQ